MHEKEALSWLLCFSLAMRLCFEAGHSLSLHWLSSLGSLLAADGQWLQSEGIFRECLVSSSSAYLHTNMKHAGHNCRSSSGSRGSSGSRDSNGRRNIKMKVEGKDGEMNEDGACVEKYQIKCPRRAHGNAVSS